MDSIPILILLLDKLVDIPVEPPSLYFDLEGINLGRHGSISIVSLYLRPLEAVYLAHIYILGSAAFSTTHNGVSLRSILESATISKVFFDIRNDSDALFSHYQISVEGINDLQLMELAIRYYSRTYVAGLARCIEQESTMSSEVKVEWRRTKESAGRRFKPEEGGKHEVFNDHPLKPDIIQFCARDVALLPELWDIYSARLHLPEQENWPGKVKAQTQKRIEDSQSPECEPRSKSKLYGPW